MKFLLYNFCLYMSVEFYVILVLFKKYLNLDKSAWFFT